MFPAPPKPPLLALRTVLLAPSLRLGAGGERLSLTQVHVCIKRVLPGTHGDGVNTVVALPWSLLSEQAGTPP